MFKQKSSVVQKDDLSKLIESNNIDNAHRDTFTAQDYQTDYNKAKRNAVSGTGNRTRVFPVLHI